MHWIKIKKVLFNLFRHYIKEIRQQIDMKFHYIASSHNPADLRSNKRYNSIRTLTSTAAGGVTVSEFNKYSLRWHGPSWLETNSLSWPV